MYFPGKSSRYLIDCYWGHADSRSSLACSEWYINAAGLFVGGGGHVGASLSLGGCSRPHTHVHGHL